jgi:hypothetical protein
VAWLDPFLNSSALSRLRWPALLAGFVVLLGGVVLWAIALYSEQSRDRIVLVQTPTTPPVYVLKAAGGVTSCKPTSSTTATATVTGRAWVDANPTGAVALWEPSGQARPCTAQLTHVDATTANNIAAQIRLGVPIGTLSASCSAELVDAGRLSFYFSYAGQTPSEVVTLKAGCGSGIYAPNRSGRSETDAFKSAVLAISPPAWRDFFTAGVAASNPATDG